MDFKINTMKKLLLLPVLSTIFSCAGLYTTTSKVDVLKTAQYESGDKDDGVVNMYLTYQPNSENVKINIPETEENAKKICVNWGFKNAELQRTEIEQHCLQINMNNGSCLVYKMKLRAICQ